MPDAAVPGHFDHPKNITWGRARIVYAPAQPTAHGQLPQGWALPGGQRTTDASRALRIAQAIDAISRGVQITTSHNPAA